MVSIQSTLLIASAIALVLFVNGGEAIRCYDCNSLYDIRCSDAKPPAIFEFNCNSLGSESEYTFCRKTVQTIDITVNTLTPDTRIIRSCGKIAENNTNQCYKRFVSGGRQNICTCDTGDLCNGAATIKETFGLLLTAFHVFTIILFINKNVFG